MARRVPRPERILSYAEGCPASAGLWIKKTSGPHGPSPPCEGRGTVQSTVVGASAAADTLQEPWTTVGRVVEIWNGKIGDPEAPVSVFPTEWKLDVRQGIRSFQDLMPPPPGKPGPPPLQGGLGLWPCWYFVRVYIDSPGAGRAGPGGVGGITSAVVASRVEHAGEAIRLPGP